MGRTLFDNTRWLRLSKRTLLVIDGQDYTEEIWLDCRGKATTELIPRQREYYGKRP